MGIMPINEDRQMLKSKNEHFYRTEVEPGETPDFVNFWHLFMGALGTEKAKGNLTFPEEMDSLYLLRTIAACAYAAGKERKEAYDTE